MIVRCVDAVIVDSYAHSFKLEQQARTNRSQGYSFSGPTLATKLSFSENVNEQQKNNERLGFHRGTSKDSRRFSHFHRDACNSTMATKTAVSSLLDDIHVSGNSGYLRIKRAGGKFTRIKSDNGRVAENCVRANNCSS
jgi:hypothetical protein